MFFGRRADVWITERAGNFALLNDERQPLVKFEVPDGIVPHVERIDL